jgi:hypothetical protein
MTVKHVDKSETQMIQPLDMGCRDWQAQQDKLSPSFLLALLSLPQCQSCPTLVTAFRVSFVLVVNRIGLCSVCFFKLSDFATDDWIYFSCGVGELASGPAPPVRHLPALLDTDSLTVANSPLKFEIKRCKACNCNAFACQCYRYSLSSRKLLGGVLLALMHSFGECRGVIGCRFAII